VADRAIPSEVATFVERWLAHHDALAPGLVEGLYLVGSLALGDHQPGSDVDVVAFTAEPATDDDAALLHAAHLAASSEAGPPIDGPRLAWADVSVPPTPLHRPWTLDGTFHHDAECFEINPITWFVLATSGIAVRGPEPADLSIALDTEERRSFVRENVDTYWRALADTLDEAAQDESRSSFPAEIVTWSVLGVARMLVTARTGQVISKSAAGQWLAAELPAHRAVIDLALAQRWSATAPSDVDRATVAATADLVRHVVALVTGR
jgi:hypothetical protein